MIQFILTEAVFILTSVLGFVAMQEFIKTTDGQLRIIMIWFFATIGLTYLLAAVNFALVFFSCPALSSFILRMAFGIPKLFIMALLIMYLKENGKKKAPPKQTGHP